MPEAPPSDYIALKRRVYLVVFPLFCASSILGILATDQAAYLKVVIGVLAAVLGGLSIWFWRTRTPSRRGEWVGILCAATFWVVYQLYWIEQGNIGDDAVLSFAIWSPTFLLLVFIALPTRSAIALSIAFYVMLGALAATRVEDLQTSQASGAIVLVSVFALAPAALIAMLVVLSELRQRNAIFSASVERFRSLAYTDALTGVANRLFLTETVEREVERSNRYRHSLCIVLFDLDRFKQINDEWGHAIGDTVLQQVAGCAERSTRATDLVGRWGGDEFLVVSPDTEPSEAVQLATRLRMHIDETVFPNGAEITCSFGVAQHVADETVADLVTRADDALYRAKESGRHEIVLDGSR